MMLARLLARKINPVETLVHGICSSPPICLESLEGIHQLNGLFLSVKSYQDTQELAYAVLHAAAAFKPKRHLIAVLATVVGQCVPSSAIAMHCLIFLASASPHAQEHMAAHSLVALLVGQLIGAADTFEPALRLGALQLLQLLAVGNPKRIVNGSSLGAVLRVVVTCLQDEQEKPCALGLQILQELVFSQKVLGCAKTSSQILPAINAIARNGRHPELSANAARIQKLLISLPLLMSPFQPESSINAPQG